LRSFERFFLIFLLANLLCLPFWAQNKPADIKYSSNFSQLLTDSQGYIKDGLYDRAQVSLQQILKLARTPEEKRKSI